VGGGGGGGRGGWGGWGGGGGGGGEVQTTKSSIGSSRGTANRQRCLEKGQYDREIAYALELPLTTRKNRNFD